ncbi:MAG: hypothetical protein ACFFB3_16915 [Candidatus Hodarchaeota archaeon]
MADEIQMGGTWYVMFLKLIFLIGFAFGLFLPILEIIGEPSEDPELGVPDGRPTTVYKYYSLRVDENLDYFTPSFDVLDYLTERGYRYTAINALVLLGLLGVSAIIGKLHKSQNQLFCSLFSGAIGLMLYAALLYDYFEILSLSHWTPSIHGPMDGRIGIPFVFYLLGFGTLAVAVLIELVQLKRYRVFSTGIQQESLLIKTENPKKAELFVALIGLSIFFLLNIVIPFFRLFFGYLQDSVAGFNYQWYASGVSYSTPYEGRTITTSYRKTSDWGLFKLGLIWNILYLWQLVLLLGGFFAFLFIVIPPLLKMQEKEVRFRNMGLLGFIVGIIASGGEWILFSAVLIFEDWFPLRPHFNGLFFVLNMIGFLALYLAFKPSLLIGNVSSLSPPVEQM